MRHTYLVHKKKHKHNRRHTGFTLLELLVVVAIIAMLTAVILFAIFGARNQGSSAANLANLRQYELALASYAQENGTYPNTTAVGAPFACLGSTACMLTGTSYKNSALLDSSLLPYLSGSSLPPINSYTLTDDAGNTSQGTVFHCENATCTTAFLYVIELGNSSCAVGSPLGTDGTYTLCLDRIKG